LAEREGLPPQRMGVAQSETSSLGIRAQCQGENMDTDSGTCPAVVGISARVARALCACSPFSRSTLRSRFCLRHADSAPSSLRVFGYLRTRTPCGSVHHRALAVVLRPRPLSLAPPCTHSPLPRVFVLRPRPLSPAGPSTLTPLRRMCVNAGMTMRQMRQHHLVSCYVHNTNIGLFMKVLVLRSSMPVLYIWGRDLNSDPCCAVRREQSGCTVQVWENFESYV
jgi:hypothetical protein